VLRYTNKYRWSLLIISNQESNLAAPRAPRSYEVSPLILPHRSWVGTADSGKGKSGLRRWSLPRARAHRRRASAPAEAAHARVTTGAAGCARAVRRWQKPGLPRDFMKVLEPGFSTSHVEVPDAVGLRSDGWERSRLTWPNGKPWFRARIVFRD